jgi:Lrp/AsnC family transcriptional regulator for asnA, asnC and gidA
MDKTDYLILSELLLDAQVSFLQIAQKLKISSYTVKSRYDKMVTAGVIHGSIINIDLSKLGYQGKVFLFITNSSNQPKKVTIEALKKIRNIMVVSEIVGPFDIIAIAPIIDYVSIKNLVSQVKNIPSVQHVNVAYINDTSFPINSSFGKILSRTSRESASVKKHSTKH